MKSTRVLPLVLAFCTPVHAAAQAVLLGVLGGDRGAGAPGPARALVGGRAAVVFAAGHQRAADREGQLPPGHLRVDDVQQFELFNVVQVR